MVLLYLIYRSSFHMEPYDMAHMIWGWLKTSKISRGREPAAHPPFKLYHKDSGKK